MVDVLESLVSRYIIHIKTPPPNNYWIWRHRFYIFTTRTLPTYDTLAVCDIYWGWGAYIQVHCCYLIRGFKFHIALANKIHKKIWTLRRFKNIVEAGFG